MLEVLYEDNHIIAVNKKISDIVQADKTGDTPLSEEVKAYIKKKYNKPGEVYLGVPHRVDRPVSGVVIFARTSKALQSRSQRSHPGIQTTRKFTTLLPARSEALHGPASPNPVPIG